MAKDDPTGVTAVRRDWLGDEAAAPGTRDELRRLARRARRRPWRTLAYATLLAGLAIGAAALRPPVYVSRVAFRVAGGGAEPYRAGRALRDWVAGSVFSDGQLRALIEEHGLPHRTADAMRDALTVEINRDGPGSQRLSVTYRGDDPARVYDTVAHLGRLAADARMRAHPPQRVHGLRLELADAGRPDTPWVGRATLLALVGIFAFLLALPLSIVGVAAFDPHVYDLDDVRRLGLAVTGAIRGFDGDNAGALEARLGHDRMRPS